MPPEDIYRQLQQHLDRGAIPFPPAQSGVDLRILKRLFAPEEAELALELSAIPEPLEKIHKRVARMPREQLSGMLDSMAKKGLILRWPVKGEVCYGKLQFVVGIYERQLNRLTAELERDVRQYFDEAFGPAVRTKKTGQMRTVPVNRTIPVERNVATYEDIRAFVNASPGPFAKMNCICRHGRDLTGEACRQTTVRENCLTIGDAARSMAASGVATGITREQMLEMLDLADREGLVLQPENTQTPMFVCCCCGCCCGVLTSLKHLPSPADYFRSNFHAEMDAETCQACGTCETRCQMDAISAADGKYQLDVTRCIGCGLCVTTCPSGALRLRQKEKARIPPPNTVALYTRILQERYGPLGTAKAVAKRALGMKV